MGLKSDTFNARELAAGRLLPHHVSAMTTIWQGAHGLAVDGECGAKTRASIEREMDTPDPRDQASDPPDQSHEWTRGFDGPLARIPSTRAEVLAAFGDPGTVAKPNKKWAKENIVTVRDLPGVPTKWFLQCHRLAEPYAREGLRRASLASRYRILRAGGWVMRHVQHNPFKPLSLHSFGIALDVNPDDNSAHSYPRGSAPEPFSEEWRRTWPLGVDRPFVEAMESAGFTWGGAWGTSGGSLAMRVKGASFIDPMHFELRIR